MFPVFFDSFHRNHNDPHGPYQRVTHVSAPRLSNARVECDLMNFNTLLETVDVTRVDTDMFNHLRQIYIIHRHLMTDYQRGALDLMFEVPEHFCYNAYVGLRIAFGYSVHAYLREIRNVLVHEICINNVGNHYAIETRHDGQHSNRIRQLQNALRNITHCHWVDGMNVESMYLEREQLQRFIGFSFTCASAAHFKIEINPTHIRYTFVVALVCGPDAYEYDCVLY